VTDFLKRTWAQIDLDAIQDNFRTIEASLAPGSRSMAIVKADAYGHGAGYVARTLQKAGASWFGVSNLDEAMQIRNAGIVEPILILAYTPPTEAARLAAFSVTQAVLNLEYARQLDAEAAKAGVQVRIHVKIDTGMTRVGLPYQHPDQDAGTIDEIERICALPHLYAEGVFTHFASADEEDDGGYTRRQFDAFMGALSKLEARGVTFSLRHCCNSAAVMLYPEMHLDLVRPGIILYGLAPAPWMKPLMPLRPAMELKTVVSMVKTVPAGTQVSYGRTYTADRDTTLATVPIGYADGYPRLMSNRAHMLLDGKPTPVVGRVCMDQCMLDVSGVPGAREGMTVTVFGRDNVTELPVEEIAALSESINYETICLIGKRVPRIFLSGGRVVGRLNYIMPER
jgi:alanine racemase